MKIRLIIRSVLSYIPGFLTVFRKGTGGTNSARYCYSVWMRHLVKLNDSGMNNLPNSIAEIGPGDSIGIGLCAILSGTDLYYGFDIIEHSNMENNLKIFEELVCLFKEKSTIPDETEFNRVKPKLSNYNFPYNILTNEHLTHCLSDERINNIRLAIKGNSSKKIKIKYIVPWDKLSHKDYQKVDLIISQAVMEHIPEIDVAYKAMHNWLNNNGFMSHQIDFSSHETHKY